jgi:hypothetical protein
MADRKEWKASARLRERLRASVHPLARWLPMGIVHLTARVLWQTPLGETAVLRSETVVPNAERLRFCGPVCFLIGRGTFSSAVMLANAAGDFDLATLIGEETGGVPNGFGEVYVFDLPHTHLEMGVSTARFVRANGDAADPRGVLPDIEARSSPEDVERGVDGVLERAKRWVEEERLKTGLHQVSSPSRPPSGPRPSRDRVEGAAVLAGRDGLGGRWRR